MKMNSAVELNQNPLLDDVDDELSESFSFEGYQVARSEFFSHLREPSISFNNFKLYANTSCVNKLEEADFVQILVNPKTLKLAIRPCSEDDKDAFEWRIFKDKRYKAKYITCRVFFAKLMELMNWNPENRYKMLGKLIQTGGTYLFIFDLKAVETYPKIYKEGQKPKSSRIPVFPAEWKNQFGLSVEEHEKQLQIDIVEGYAVFDVKKHPARKPKVEEGEKQWSSKESQPSPSTL